MSEINPARPAPGTALIALDEIECPGAVALDFRTADALYSIIIARDENGGAYAYENNCPHLRTGLERFDGVMLVEQQRYLICAMHAASFRMNDGYCVGGPPLGARLTPEPIAIENGIVLLGIV
jgi:nitrite reductase/ring-hydroxylating ferredoxin subunit